MYQQQTQYQTEEKLNFIVDILADDFCECDETGDYVIKPEARAMFLEQVSPIRR